MGNAVLPSVHARSRPVLGLRRQPGRLVLAVFRMPLTAYHHGMGWLLGHTFLLLTHLGRKTGQPRETVAMVLRYQPETQEAVVCSAWGPDTDWMQNIRAHPASRVQIGREEFTPQQRFLSEPESMEVVAECLDKHPWRFRFAAFILGWGDLRVESIAHDFVQIRPFVAFRPALAPKAA
jgi:deazaflavin-dependent oxidoreductase (nitroreductase family)